MEKVVARHGLIPIPICGAMPCSLLQRIRMSTWFYRAQVKYIPVVHSDLALGIESRSKTISLTINALFESS